MRNPLRFTLRFLVIVAVIAALPALLGPASPGGSPYLSALSNLSTGSVIASTHCPDKVCSSFSGPCAKAAGYTCAGGGGFGQCFTKACQ
jgi:hypothetical protein